MIKNFSKQLFSLAVILIVIGAWKWFSFSSVTEHYKDRQAFKADYKIYAFNLPEKIEFAGEPMPMHDFELLERLDRELLVNTYWQSQTLLFFKRANRYFPVIEPILKKHGVPDDFKYLALIESGLTNAVSPAGAAGFWQFLEPTARQYGLEVSDEVDERYNLVKATEAACLYLKEAHKIFGSWTLAAASYNMGMAGLRRSQARQEAQDYYDLMLNSETSRYVFRILAIKEIMENPIEYGIHIKRYQMYDPLKYSQIKVDTSVNSWVGFAKKQNINYKLLRYYNPWIRNYSLNNKENKTYVINVPKVNENDSVFLQQLFADGQADEVLQQLDSHIEEIVIKDPFVHRVKKGETLMILSQMYEVSVNQIIDWNDLTESPLKDGQSLKIYR